MRYITIILLFISSLAMAQRPYLFPTIADAASNTYIGIGAYVQTQGYSASGDGGGALYRMTAIASAPMAADSGYVYPVTATKVLVQVLADEFLNTATYGVVCGSSAQATNNFNRLQRFFTAINTLDKQAFVNGCNDTIYVNFTSALTTTLTSHDKFVMRGEGADVTRIKATAGSIDFGFSDAAKVNLFDLYLDGYDATAFGGIGGADQSLTYVNDTLTISGGNYVVITGGGGGGTDDQTLSIDSNANTFTLTIESGNSVQFSKTTNTDDQAISLDSTATSYTATVEDGGSITWAKVTDTDTDDQTLSVDSTAYKYTITIADGNAIDFAKSQDNSVTNELQTITLDSVSGTYNLSLSNGGGTVKIKRDTDTDNQTLSLVTNTLSISEGNSVDLAAYLDNTDDQVISIDSNATTYTLTLESGGSIKILKSVNTDAQTLSFSNPNLSISGGNSVDISGIDTDTDDQTLSIDSNATTYTLTIVDGNNVKFAKGGGGSPGGTHNDLQINRSGFFTGTDSLEWVGATGYLKVLGRIDQTYGVNSTAVGSGALQSDDKTSNRNTAMGFQAASAMITSLDNTAVGYQALKSGTGGQNTALGASSLAWITQSGNANTAIGYLSHNRLTSGSWNTGIGAESIENTTTANYETAVGFRAGERTNGGENTMLGALSGMEHRTGSGSIFIGYNSGRYHGAGTSELYQATNSIFIGYQARAGADSISNETVIGYDLVGNGANTVTIGNSSVTDNYFSGNITHTGRIDQTYGVSSNAIGFEALLNDDGTNNAHVGIGYQAGKSLTTGTSTVAIGYLAGSSFTASDFGMVAIGRNAGTTSRNGSVTVGYYAGETTGQYNTLIGFDAGRQGLTTTDNCVGIGYQVLYRNDTDFATGIGYRALREANDALGAIAIGKDAGYYVGSGTGNTLQQSNYSIYLGYEARAGADSISNETVIGYDLVGNGANTVTIGNSSVTDTHLGGTVHSSGAYIGKVTTFNTASGQTTYGDYICLVDYTSTGIATLTIDTDNLVNGYTLIIKDMDGNAGANTITIATEGAETIDGASTATITTNYGAVRLFSDGVNWYTY